MKELTWRSWNSWIDMNELKRMNWHECIEMSDLIEMTDLKWRNWNEFRTESMKWMNSNEWIDMNELKRMNWNEWIEMNDLSTLSSKIGPNPSVFDDLYVKSSSRYSLVHILSTTFRIEPWNRGNRDPPAATRDSHFTLKNAGFCARECFQPWIHTFPIAHTSQLLDDVVDMMIEMMMWLPYWWDS